MPKNINIEVLKNGITDLTLLKEWGVYLSKDEENGLKKVTTSQIRKFFGAIKKIQADFENSKSQILFLEPKLAYAVGRDLVTIDRVKVSKSKIGKLYELFQPFIIEIQEDKKKFKVFVSILEAIVAYHKAAGGE